MSADTETIREALETAGMRKAEHLMRPALAALGRVEERERALTEALEETAQGVMARVRAALAGSVAEGEA